MHLSRTSVLLLGFLLVLLPCITNAKKHYFELDPQVLAHQPLPFKSFRVITPKYNDAKTAYYGIPHPVTLSNPKPLATQIEALLANSACKNCDGNTDMAIAIQDFNFYDVTMPGDMMIVYIHADFFIGRKDALHHVYTIDRWFHKPQSSDDLGSYSARYVSDCILSCVEDACLNTAYPSKATFTDKEADNYYEDALQKYPLYFKGTVPKGIYKTVDDFINLTPLDTPLFFEHIPQAESQGFNWFYYKSLEGKKGKRVSPQEAYVISEGENFWLSHNGVFQKIKKQNGDLFLEIDLESAANIESDYANGSFGLLHMAMQEGRTEPGASSMRKLNVLGRFSPQKKAYIPYGGKAPILRKP